MLRLIDEPLWTQLNRPFLRTHERLLLTLEALGLDDVQKSRSTGISTHVLRNHFEVVESGLGVGTRTGAVVKGWLSGLLPDNLFQLPEDDPDPREGESEVEAAYRRLVPAEALWILLQLGQGHTIEEIARALGRSASSVDCPESYFRLDAQDLPDAIVQAYLKGLLPELDDAAL